MFLEKKGKKKKKDNPDICGLTEKNLQLFLNA